MSMDWRTLRGGRLALAAAVAGAAVTGVVLLAVSLLASDGGEERSLLSGSPTSTVSPEGTTGPQATEAPAPTTPPLPTATLLPPAATSPPVSPPATAIPSITAAATATPPPTATPTSTIVPPTPTATVPQDTTPPLIIGPNITGAAMLGTEFRNACAAGFRTKTVSAQISDASGILNAFLHYQAPGEAVQSILMSPSQPYSAVLGPFSTPPGQVSYWIQAEDLNGNEAISLVRELTLVLCT